MNDKFNDKENKLTQLEKDLNTLASQLKQLKVINTQKVGNLSSEINKSQIENETLQEEIENTKKSKQEIIDKYNDLEKTLKLLQSDCDNLNITNESLKVL